MEDPALNRSLEETRELQTRWNQFREFVRMAIERGKATPEAEMKFLELKSFIAMLHDGFMAKLNHDHKTGQNIMAIVGDAIMLRRICLFNDAEKQKFEFDWNECYLLISEQVAALDGEKNRLAAISERTYKAGKMREMIRAKIHNFFHSAGLKWTMIFGGLVVGLYIVPAFIYSYRNFAQIPVLDKVYYFVADRVYRPFLNSNYGYDHWENVHAKPNAPEDNVMGRIQPADASQLTPENFKSSVLSEIGFSRAAAAEAQKMFDEKREYFESQRFKADNADARFYYIIFKTTEDAVHFMELANTSLKAADLPQQAKDDITHKVFVKRMANLVAIGISAHQLRAELIYEKFYVNKERNGSSDLHL